jgi:type I restriction-modification system DNA methylase subunit
MPLFQKAVLKSYFNDLQLDEINVSYIRLQQLFQIPLKQRNISNSKEEQYQEGFLRELFVSVLGYTLNPDPNYNLITEQKNEKDNKKADGAILLNGKVKAVIELKSTKTVDLSSIESQAFGYKNNQKECEYVITSNFQKVRFYIGNAVDYEEFNLFILTLEEFKLLWVCLSKEYLIRGIPSKIKEASNNQEETITKKLYADYAAFRKALFQNVCEKNTDLDRVILFKKTQKLLDRFLFLFFAEDRGLVSPNWTRRILQDWIELKDRFDNYIPLYNRFRKNFDYLNTGFTGRNFEIFAYNGGLFLPDDILDSLVIDDDLLYNGSLKLSNYDFDSEVDVNILGHIFEHSLNEIDELQADSAFQVGKQTRRKKDGVFYTPKYITKYIVDNTIGILCLERREILEIIESDYEFIDVKAAKSSKKLAAKRASLNKRLDDYREWLLDMKIVDPACGSGAFLNQALEFLIVEHTRIDELRAVLLGGSIVLSDVENSILERNLYGVDINEEAVEIAKLSLWLRTARKGRKLSSLNTNIKVGNSLVDDPAVAPGKAFNWPKEFETVFREGGFDVVIGNPPYGATFNQAEKLFLSKYRTFKYRFESYVYFYEKGIDILKPGGVLGYITPELWLRLENCYLLRLLVFQETDLIEINIVGEGIFSDAVVNTNITLLRKEKKRNSFKIVHNGLVWSRSYDSWYKAKLTIEYRVNGSAEEIVNKIQQKSIPLKEFGEVIQGITPYDKYRGQDPELIKARGFHCKYKKDSTYGKWLNGEDINRFLSTWSGEWLSYGPWLGAARESRFFEEKRILFREIPGRNRRIQAAYTEGVSYYGHSITPFILKQGIDSQILKAILAIVNSRLISWYGNIKLPNFGKEVFPKLNPQDIKLLPIARSFANRETELIKVADLMISLNQKLFDLDGVFSDLLAQKFGLTVKKTLSLSVIESKQLFKEFKKQKILLTLREQSEWLEYFNEQKLKAQIIKTDIEQTDKIIDKLVYELYELSEEEVIIVEGP